MSSLRIISGGQTGVDQAALRAAKQLLIPTGGWMPKGWLTEDGPRPDFEELYGMAECQAEDYPARTEKNVQYSDMTLWLGGTGSRGYAATNKACLRHRKQCLLVDYYGPDGVLIEIRQQLKPARPLVVNCAGNRESGNPGVGAEAEAFFLALFAVFVK